MKTPKFMSKLTKTRIKQQSAIIIHYFSLISFITNEVSRVKSTFACKLWTMEVETIEISTQTLHNETHWNRQFEMSTPFHCHTSLCSAHTLTRIARFSNELSSGPNVCVHYSLIRLTVHRRTDDIDVTHSLAHLHSRTRSKGRWNELLSYRIALRQPAKPT